MKYLIAVAFLLQVALIYAQTCPDGRRPVYCTVNPCSLPVPAGCGGLQCVPNYCGGCRRRWYNVAGQEVNCAVNTNVNTNSNANTNNNVNTNTVDTNIPVDTNNQGTY